MVNLLINIIIIQLFLGNIGCFFGGGKCEMRMGNVGGITGGRKNICSD